MQQVDGMRVRPEMEKNKEDLHEKEQGELVKHDAGVKVKILLIGHEACELGDVNVCGSGESKILTRGEDKVSESDSVLPMTRQ